MEERLHQPLSHQDAQADIFRLQVRRDFTPVELTGMRVTGYMTFANTRSTLPIEGMVSGNAALVTLTDDCYAVPGHFMLTIQVSDGTVRHTLLHLHGEIIRTTGEQIISSGELLPTLPQLLEDIAEMQAATSEARQVAQSAQQAAKDAGQAATDAAQAVQQAQQAVQEATGAAQAISGMTVSAVDGTTAAAQLSEQNGAKHIRFTLPRGKDGQDGKDGQNGLNGQNGKDGKTPVKGTDYFTAADQSAIVNQVKAIMPALTLTGTDDNGTQHTWTIYGGAG